MVLNDLQFLGTLGWAEIRLLDVSEKLSNVLSVPRLVQQPLHIVCIGRAERSCDQGNNILIPSEHFGILEIIPGGLHHLAKQSAALRDGNGMLDLPEQFPPFLAVYVFYDNNEVVCIKTVNLALKFDFPNGPARKTGGVPAGKHQRNK